MRKLLLTLAFAVAAAAAYCAPRSLEAMKKAAKSAISKTAGLATRGGSVQLEVMKQGKQYTVLGYATGGFAVIANDDTFNAVLGYSDSEFTSGSIPPAMQWWMDAVDQALGNILADGAQTVTLTAPADMGYKSSVLPLVTTAWDQSKPYNNMIVETFNEEYLTGCVATAMAQIMKSHNYPVQGRGLKAVTINGKYYIADFESTTYQWELMRDAYTNGFGAMPPNYTDEEAAAVAQLMLHCGVAVDMNYGVDASGAHNFNAATALDEYFAYSTKYFLRDIYTEDDWMDLVYSELSEGRPILYGGATPDGYGHSFVIDGYNVDGLVHVNWGWSGMGTAYCDISLLNSGQGNFSEGQDMTFARDASQPQLVYSSQWGISPTVTWVSGGSTYYDTYGSFTVTQSAGTLTFNAVNLMNCGAENFSGQIALLAEPVDGGTQTVLMQQSVMNVTSNSLVSNTNPEFTGMAMTGNLPDGTYRVYLASKAMQETAWQPVRSNESIVNNYIITKQGLDITIAEGEPGWTTGIESVAAEGDGGDGMVRVYTADGVLVYTAAADAFSIDDVPATGLLIVKNGAKTTKVVK